MVWRFALNGLRSNFVPSHRFLSKQSQSPLVELGRLTAPNAPGTPYKPGNHMLHAQLGYRGVVVDKWAAAVHTYPTLSSQELAMRHASSSAPHIRDVAEAEVHSATYYQVFCDSRDSQDIKCGLGLQQWTHLDSNLSGCVDYVEHKDIIPMTPAPNATINNGLHSIYFRRNSMFASGMLGDIKYHDKSVLTGDYTSWEHLTKKCLSNSKVYRAKTDDISVTVIPFADHQTDVAAPANASSEPAASTWFYQVLIENQGSTPIQLMSRLWHIRDENGVYSKVSGQGVVGIMPVLSPHSSSFQYISSMSLPTQSGIMGGSFVFVELLPGGVHGRTIDCSIPTFQLTKTAARDAEASEIERHTST
jgi:ApaG protein